MRTLPGARPSRQEHRRLAALDFISPLPDPFNTLEEWERARHMDLAAMTRTELARERERVRLRLMLSDDRLDGRDVDWLGARLAALTKAIR